MRVDTQLLKATLKYHDLTYGTAGKILNMRGDVMSQKIKYGKFTIKQIHALMEGIPLTMEEMEKIFFAN